MKEMEKFEADGRVYWAVPKTYSKEEAIREANKRIKTSKANIRALHGRAEGDTLHFNCKVKESNVWICFRKGGGE